MIQLLQRPYDDPEDSSASFWQKASANRSAFSQPKTFESQLALKSKNGKKGFKICSLKLVDDKLINFKRKNQTQVKYIELGRVFCIIEMLKDKDLSYPFGFSLVYNAKMQLFRSKEEQLIKDWVQHLSAHCLSVDFDKKYRIFSSLGSGGYAKVSLVEQISTNQQYAAKMIHFPKQDKIKDRKKHRDMVLNEIAAMKKLDHPNIAKMKSLYIFDNKVCIVMEYVRGKKMIDDIKDRGSYSEQKAAILISQMLGALSYCHEQKIIHRDLKPENMLVCQEDDKLEIKLIDFGLAAFIGMKYHGFKKCGTAGFIAPEIFRDEPFSEQIDIFSVGVILFISLCGKPPFKGKNYYDLLKKNFLCDYKFELKYWRNVSDDAKHLIKRMMDPYPNTRITIKDALNHEWFKKYLPKADLMQVSRVSSIRQLTKKEEHLRPSTRDGSNLLNSIQNTEDSEYIPDMTQKLRSLVFSNPNLIVSRENLLKIKPPSFYQLSPSNSPMSNSPMSKSSIDLDKIDFLKEKLKDDVLKIHVLSNPELISQGSFALRPSRSNYDRPYQINIHTCQNIEDITEEDADDHPLGLQMKIKEYNRRTVNVKKPKDKSFIHLREKTFSMAVQEMQQQHTRGRSATEAKKEPSNSRQNEVAKENRGSDHVSNQGYSSTIRIPSRLCCP